jgi:hypothetical protein
MASQVERKHSAPTGNRATDLSAAAPSICHSPSVQLIFITVCTAFALAGCLAIEPPKLGSGPPVVLPNRVLVSGRAPVTGAAARFAFLDITGVPSGQLRNFEKALEVEAGIRRLTLVPDGDPTATYQVRGYLSAIGDSRSTLLVYVWDVFDTSGQRLHRITGQEAGKGSGTDPWLGIGQPEMAAAARRTIDALTDWTTPR